MLDQRAKIKNQNQTKSSKMELRYRAFYLSIDEISRIIGTSVLTMKGKRNL